MNTFQRKPISLEEIINSEFYECKEMFEERERIIQSIYYMMKDYNEKVASHSSWESLHQAQGELLNILKVIKRKVQECEKIEIKIKNTAHIVIDFLKDYDNKINTLEMKLDENQRSINEIKQKMRLFEEDYI